jgi:hypothetical protein
VPIGVGAFSKDFFILFIRPRGMRHFMGSIEVGFSRNVQQGHIQF